jgi:hypothetical protein
MRKQGLPEEFPGARCLRTEREPQLHRERRSEVMRLKSMVSIAALVLYGATGTGAARAANDDSPFGNPAPQAPKASNPAPSTAAAPAPAADGVYERDLAECRQAARDIPLSDLKARAAALGAGTAASQVMSIPSPMQSAATSAFGGGVFIAQILLGAIAGSMLAEANEKKEREQLLKHCLQERGHTAKAGL